MTMMVVMYVNKCKSMNKVTMTVNKCNIKIDYKGKSNINWQRKVNKEAMMMKVTMNITMSVNAAIMKVNGNLCNNRVECKWRWRGV